MEKISVFLQKSLIWLINFYRIAISSAIPPRCGFEPCCSSYAIEAITKHGAFKGCWLTGKRLIRCHPLCKGGYDPVPSKLIKPNPAESNIAKSNIAKSNIAK